MVVGEEVSLVMLTVFGEVASIPFLALACLVAGLLSTRSARTAD